MSIIAALKPVSSTHNDLFEGKDTLHKIRETFSKELIIGLCGPIGAPLRTVATAMHELLTEKYEYHPDKIKLSEFIEKFKGTPPLDTDKSKRYRHLIDKGNELRLEHGNAILAELAIKHISLRRAATTTEEDPEPKPVRFCHIIDSIKNTEEIEILRAVYGDLFILIGVHSSPEDRARSLKAGGVSEQSLSSLMDTDSGEDFAHGQEVRKSFPLSDFFIHAIDGNTTLLKDKLERILSLITKTRIITPTKHETAMYHAHAVSMNSGCLSRQVGAAVTDETGDVIGLGWNDVPQFMGGLYAESSKTDHRCMHRDGGQCFNDLEKDTLAEQITLEIGKAIPSIKALHLEVKKQIKASRIKDLIEFSRAVHAEMMAIINAGATANGHRVKGGKIYVTTYPCHSCARHIIAAGLCEVVYIEPYRKSLAIRLHSDAISEETNAENKVRIRPFEGVGPSRYADFFEINARTPRKGADGKMILAKNQTALFTSSTSLKSFPALEGLIVEQLTMRGLVIHPEKAS